MSSEKNISCNEAGRRLLSQDRFPLWVAVNDPNNTLAMMVQSESPTTYSDLLQPLFQSMRRKVKLPMCQLSSCVLRLESVDLSEDCVLPTKAMAKRLLSHAEVQQNTNGQENEALKRKN
eukprot:1137180-Amphidinium_carterae.1